MHCNPGLIRHCRCVCMYKHKYIYIISLNWFQLSLLDKLNKATNHGNLLRNLLLHQEILRSENYWYRHQNRRQAYQLCKGTCKDSLHVWSNVSKNTWSNVPELPWRDVNSIQNNLPINFRYHNVYNYSIVSMITTHKFQWSLKPTCYCFSSHANWRISDILGCFLHY